jgi:DHA1 family bicyclomycin/chloramphenicol resistance-like MFS transporter
MNLQSEVTAKTPHPGMGFREFVVLMAGLMATNALSIDSMLPALPAIGHALGVATDNQRQWVITSYLLGFGVAQLIYGPLADRYGRRPILTAGLAVFFVFSVLAAFAWSFETLLIARVLQGVGVAGTRVLAVSIIRDCYAGRTMARVMSLTFIVFFTVPILAPSVGQAVMLVAPWPWIFGVLAIFGGAVGLWAAIRLPETLHPEDRRPIALHSIWNAVRTTLSQRVSVGYMVAQTITTGGMFGFVTSAQQIFVDVFDQEAWFPILFAVCAIGMGFASYVNASIVERLGQRRVSHTALLLLIAVAGLHAGVALAGLEQVWTFVAFQSMTMFCFGLMGSNFNSMAMEPLGHIAGTASSVQGFVTTTIGALIGFAIGQQFDGSTLPLAIGFMLVGIGCLAIVLVTERGTLFRSALVRSVPVPP